MGSSNPYSYAVLRVVPRIERGERMNVGVVLFSRPARFLGVRTAFDEARLLALWPEADAAGIRLHLAALERIAAGDPGAGPVAAFDQTARFHWLTAPSSTIIQASELHSGLCGEPEAELEKLFAALVQAP